MDIREGCGWSQRGRSEGSLVFFYCLKGVSYFFSFLMHLQLIEFEVGANRDFIFKKEG